MTLNDRILITIHYLVSKFDTAPFLGGLKRISKRHIFAKVPEHVSVELGHLDHNI